MDAGNIFTCSRWIKRVKEYKVWQDGNHPEFIFSPEFQKQKLDYLHMNPVEAEFVNEHEHYLYSSAKDYYTLQKGILEVEVLD